MVWPPLLVKQEVRSSDGKSVSKSGWIQFHDTRAVCSPPRRMGPRAFSFPNPLYPIRPSRQVLQEHMASDRRAGAGVQPGALEPAFLSGLGLPFWSYFVIVQYYYVFVFITWIYSGLLPLKRSSPVLLMFSWDPLRGHTLPWGKGGRDTVSRKTRLSVYLFCTVCSQMIRYFKLFEDQNLILSVQRWGIWGPERSRPRVSGYISSCSVTEPTLRMGSSSLKKRE